MPPGRKPKPAHLRIIEGKPGGRPVPVEPKSDQLQPPSEALSETHRVAWAELVDAARWAC